MADLILAHQDRLAALIVAEVGKPARQAADELDFAVGFLSYSAEWDRRLEGEILPGDVPGEIIHLSHAPVGVVAAICPWNFPLAVLCRKLGPALITGNTVVVKPSEVSPLTTIELFRLIDARARPAARRAQPRHRRGATTGRALVADVTTSMVSFTGHRDTGKAIMAAAAAQPDPGRAGARRQGAGDRLARRRPRRRRARDRRRPPHQRRPGLHLRRAGVRPRRPASSRSWSLRRGGRGPAPSVTRRRRRHGAAGQRAAAGQDQAGRRDAPSARGPSVVTGGCGAAGRAFRAGLLVLADRAARRARRR